MTSKQPESIIDLKKMVIINNTMYLHGIGILLGYNAKNYSDIHYELIMQSANQTHIKELAKSHHPELTAQYGQNALCYDKCWFATRAYQGIDISDVPAGEYQLFLKIWVNRNRTEYLYEVRSEALIHINTHRFSFKSDVSGNKLVLYKDALPSQISITPFHQDKIKVNGFYQDSNNNIIDAPEGLQNVHVQFGGKNNHVVIHKKSNLKNTFIECKGDNGTFTIGRYVRFFGTFRLGHGCGMYIGNLVSSTGSVYATCAEYTSLNVGDDCMFATNNQIRTDDAHAIYDVHTGKRVNHSKNIVIGSHVWVAYGATILGGSHIGNGSVIGAYALVTKKIPNNVVAAGIPAKVIRRDIFWERPFLLGEEDEKVFPSEYLNSHAHISPTND